MIKIKKMPAINLPVILLLFINAYGGVNNNILHEQKTDLLPLSNRLGWEDYQYNEISYGECKVEYMIPKETSENDIQTIFLFISGQGWFDPTEYDLEGNRMSDDIDFLCDGRESSLFAQLSYQGVCLGYGLEFQLNDSIGAMKGFVKSFPNAEIYVYAFSAGVNVFFNAFVEMPIELQMQFKGAVSWSPAPDPSSAAFNWCIDLLANLPMTASMEDKLAEVRKFSCVERLQAKEVSQKLRIVLMRGTDDELIPASDFQFFKEIMDAKTFVKTIYYYGLGHNLPWEPVIEQLKAIESLNQKRKMMPER